jgi:hypothetical protein
VYVFCFELPVDCRVHMRAQASQRPARVWQPALAPVLWGSMLHGYWANLAIACVVDHLPYMVSYAVNYCVVVLSAGGQVISFLF